jgi:hypothetical protein
VSKVQASNHKRAQLQRGELVPGWPPGWQDYAVSGWQKACPPSRKRNVTPRAHWALGTPGFNGPHGPADIGRPAAGETVVVAVQRPGGLGGGPVTAKIKGCTVIGIAGGADKCDTSPVNWASISCV